MRKVLGYIILGSLLLTSVFPVLADTGLSSEKIHVVQAGETLFSIARWYGVDLWTLARHNGIVNPSHIYVGQRLRIPTGGTPAPSAGVYVVQPGDTLYSVARAYGTTAWAIAQANGLYNMHHIYVGQRLVIPGAASNPPAPQPTATPAPARPSNPAPPSSATTGWQGAYYTGTDLSGGPKFVRTDRAVNFHWGDESPDTRLNTDEFSVRWTRVINFRGGVYRFSMTADDGARIWVDGELVLDAWEIEPGATHEVGCHADAGRALRRDRLLRAGGHRHGAIFLQALGGCAFDAATPTPTPTGDGTATPAPTSEASTVAWWGEYYANRDLTGEPAVTRWDPHLGFEWEQESPMPDLLPDGFSVRWTREVYFYDDNYGICARADDGVRLYIDGDLIIDEWRGSDATQNYCVEVDLHERYHTVVVEYYEHEVDALIYVWWDRR